MVHHFHYYENRIIAYVKFYKISVLHFYIISAPSFIWEHFIHIVVSLLISWYIVSIYYNSFYMTISFFYQEISSRSNFSKLAGSPWSYYGGLFSYPYIKLWLFKAKWCIFYYKCEFLGKLDIPGFQARKWLAIAEFSKFSKIFFGFDIVA